ncbi:MAG: tetratricopeptide repeat protein [Pseudomonadota bacterium]
MPWLSPKTRLILLLLTLPYRAFAHAGLHEEIDRLSVLIRANPVDASLYLQRGEAYRVHGDRDAALADFHAALEQGADAGQAETGLGRVYADQGEYGNALRHLDQALALRPGAVRALVARAGILRATGRPLAAAADYTRAILQFAPPRKPLPEYYLERARSYEAAGKMHLEAALRGLEDGIAVLGPVPTLVLYAAELEARLGRTDAALARLDGMLASAQRSESLLVKRADILLQAERFAAARDDLLAAQAAIAELPLQRRHSRLVQSLEAGIRTRLATLEQRVSP